MFDAAEMAASQVEESSEEITSSSEYILSLMNTSHPL
jgi:hypothetical protein